MEDSNVHMYRRRLAKNHLANRLTDHTVYSAATRNPTMRYSDCETAAYPGSFAQNGLYIRGESKQPAYPDYDRTMAQDRQYDQQYYPFVSEKEFRDQYGRIAKEYIRSDNAVKIAGANSRVGKPGVFTATGYRGPSKLDKDIARAREARIERFFDY